MKRFITCHFKSCCSCPKAVGIHDLSKDLEQTVTYLASDKLNEKQEQKQ